MTSNRNLSLILTKREQEVLDKLAEKEVDFYACILALYTCRMLPFSTATEIANSIEAIFDDAGAFLAPIELAEEE